MWRTRIEESAYGNGMWGKGQGDEKGVGIRKSGHIESDVVSYADKVNATLRPCSIFLRVADYFFESVESALDLGAKTLAAWQYFTLPPPSPSGLRSDSLGHLDCPSKVRVSEQSPSVQVKSEQSPSRVRVPVKFPHPQNNMSQTRIEPQTSA